MKFAAIFFALALAAASAFAQPAKRPDGKQGQMRQDERERKQARDVYRERQGRPDRPRQMTPEERAKLRKDIEETSRDLRRK